MESRGPLVAPAGAVGLSDGQSCKRLSVNIDNMATKERIIEAGLDLLTEGGPEAMSTRAVSAAAGVQAPAIYRLFGDKQGLLDAVTAHKLDEYLADKATRERAVDPVDDLREGWAVHVNFGLANPAVYAAIYGTLRTGQQPPAVERANEILLEMMHRIAAAGRLRVDERTAAQVVHSAGRGVTLVLINTPEDERDMRLVDHVREAAIAAITTGAEPKGDDPVGAAGLTLRAALPESTALSEPERNLMIEWLDRLVGPGPR